MCSCAVYFDCSGPREVGGGHPSPSLGGAFEDAAPGRGGLGRGSGSGLWISNGADAAGTRGMDLA